MTKVAMIRCEKNLEKCPQTSCFAAMMGRKEGFQIYSNDCIPAGVFVCHCPGDDTVEKANILKNKGAEAIHFCTCTFATKGDDGWDMKKGGFCDRIDAIIEKVHQTTGLPCVKGTAHLPEGYSIQKWG